MHPNAFLLKLDVTLLFFTIFSNGSWYINEINVKDFLGLNLRCESFKTCL